MNLTDYLVIAAILVSAVAGAMRGFLREAIAFGAWIVALFVAWHFSDLIEPHLGGLLSDSTVRPWAARVIIVVLVLLLGMAIGSLLSHFVRLSIFSGMDRLLGFGFGLLRGFVLLGVFVILGQLLRLSRRAGGAIRCSFPTASRSPTGCARWSGRPHVAHARGEVRYQGG